MIPVIASGPGTVVWPKGSLATTRKPKKTEGSRYISA